MRKSRLLMNSVLAVVLCAMSVAIQLAVPQTHVQAVTLSGISLTKVASPDRIHPGDPVTYTIEVRNDSGFNVQASIADATLGFSEFDVPIAAGHQVTYNLTANPLQDVTNTAAVLAIALDTGDIKVDPVLVTANASVDVLNPAVMVTKTASPGTVHAGEAVTYSIVVTNSGDTWLTVDVNDDHLGEIAGNMALDAGTVVTLVVTDTPTANVTNTVTVTGTDEIGGTVSATANASVTVLGQDTTPPRIVLGPQVSNVTADSATITWQTDERSNSVVIYGIEAGEYPLSAGDDVLVADHTIVLDGLAPATTYHFMARSADASGNSAASRDMFFLTDAAPDSTPPTVLNTGPLVWQGTTLVAADASDDSGVSKVEFFIDGELAFTDYSYPFKFFLDTSRYDNGSHQLDIRTTDAAGNSSEESAPIEVVNIQDAENPVVQIIYPSDGQTVSGKITAAANLTDDTGLFKATMRIAKKSSPNSEWWGDWYPNTGTSTSAVANFTLDSYSLDNGEYRLAVEAYDKDLNYGVGFVDIMVSNTPPPPPPNLVVSRSVAMSQNYFTISLKVKNTGGETATNIRLQDYLQLFQPIDGSDAVAQYTSEYAPELTSWRMHITSGVAIPAGQEKTYTYDAVPVLLYPASVTPMIGGDKYSGPNGSTRLWYEGPTGLETYYDDVGLLFSPTVQGTSYDEALKVSDYLIVTSPTNLLRLNPEAEVNELLSSMAELARLKNGVLGFLDVPVSQSSDYEIYDALAAGDVLGDDKDELVIGNRDRDLIAVAHVPNQPITVSNTVSYDVLWQEYWGFKCGNYEEGFEAGDQLATGNLVGGAAKEQIVMADFSADRLIVYDGNGKLVWVYVIDDPDSFDPWDIEAFDGLAAGNLNGVGPEDVVFADRSEDQVFVLNFPTPDLSLYQPGYGIYMYATVVSQFSKDFEVNDGLAVGDVMGDNKEEIVIADRSQDKVFIFSYTGALIGYFSRNFEEGDQLAVGNVIYTWPDNKAEIIIADHDQDGVYVYQADGTLVTSFSRDIESFDGLASGTIHGGYVDEIVIADRSDDSFDFYDLTAPFQSKYQLKDLIKATQQTGLFYTSQPVATGAWSKKLKSDWVSNGYLLIVGETDIIPTWGGKSFGTVKTPRGDEQMLADVTDYPYTSTYGEEIKPELSIGRIIGNTAEELRKPIEASIAVSEGTPGYGFDRSHGLVVSGYSKGLGGDADPIDFQGEATKAGDTLKNSGVSITTMKTPDYTKYDSSGAIDEVATTAAFVNDFFANTPNKDVIFLSGHGGGDHWDLLHWNDVLKQADPFAGTNPFVYASSCTTGRYVHFYSIANTFLSRGAAAYLGATNWGLGSQGWISEYLYKNWDPGEPIGLTVKQVKRSIGGFTAPPLPYGGGGGGFIVNQKERYWSAIYHLFGDPKFGSEGPPAATSSALLLQSAFMATEPPSSFEVEVPYYEVEHLADGDHVTIPGGGLMSIEELPPVPYYMVAYDYPADYQIQDVIMSERSSPVIETGLEIQPFAEATGEDMAAGQSPVQSASAPEWWPTAPFTWDVIEGPETDTLIVTVFPFQYSASAGEGRFYQHCSFDVDFLRSDVRITGLTADRSFYQLGELVNIQVDLASNASAAEQDVVISATVREETSEELVDGLPLLTVHDLQGAASCSFAWDSSGADPGSYMIEAEVHDSQGNRLARELVGIVLVTDSAPPDVDIVQPVPGLAVQDGTSLRAYASDDVEVSQVYFWITGSSGPASPVSLEKGMPATLESGTAQAGLWTFNFDSTVLPDGGYSLLAEATDSQGNTRWSDSVPFTIRNLAVVALLPASQRNKPGRMMPVKFSLCVAGEVDPGQPFVANEDLVVRIYKEGPDRQLLQESRFGTGAEDYRIDLDDELYVTNFKTLKEPAEYTVEVWREAGPFLLGSFTFDTG